VPPAPSWRTYGTLATMPHNQTGGGQGTTRVRGRLYLRGKAKQKQTPNAQLAASWAAPLMRQATPAGGADRTLLQKLAADKDENVRAKAAKNKGCPPVLLELLAGDPATVVRQAVGGNINTRPGLLELLAADQEPDVRKAVGGNINTPPGTLGLLADDMFGQVRVMVAKNPKTPPAVLQRLSGDPDYPIRAAVAGNKQTGAVNQLGQPVPSEHKQPADQGASPAWLAATGVVPAGRGAPSQDTAGAVVGWFRSLFSHLFAMLVGR